MFVLISNTHWHLRGWRQWDSISLPNGQGHIGCWQWNQSLIITYSIPSWKIQKNCIIMYFVVRYDLLGNKNGSAFMFQSTNKIFNVCKFIAYVWMKFWESVTYFMLQFFSAKFASVLLASLMFVCLVCSVY